MRIEHEIVDEAPLVPVAGTNELVFVSKRVVGNVQLNPQWHLLVDQIWVR